MQMWVHKEVLLQWEGNSSIWQWKFLQTALAPWAKKWSWAPLPRVGHDWIITFTNTFMKQQYWTGKWNQALLSCCWKTRELCTKGSSYERVTIWFLRGLSHCYMFHRVKDLHAVKHSDNWWLEVLEAWKTNCNFVL